LRPFLTDLSQINARLHLRLLKIYMEWLQMAKDQDWDFGFSFVSDEEMKAQELALSEKLKSVQSGSKEQVDALKGLIMAFLNNMIKDPEKPWIYWPNRVERVREFMDRINKI